MFLTITSIVVAALFGGTLTVAIRLSNINNTLRHKIKDAEFKIKDTYDDKEILKSSLDKICTAMTHEDVTYFATPCTSGSRWVVLRRCFVAGREYNTFIKDFNDEDAEFNRREADELCEILNSK